MTADISRLNEAARHGLHALVQLLGQDITCHVPPPDHRRPFLVGWGLLSALSRQARAVVLLHDQGLGHEAAPNRRLMIEYMAQLQWLDRDGEDAVDSMNKVFQHTHGKLRTAVDAGGFHYDDEIAADADAVKTAVIPSNATNQYAQTSKLLGLLDTGVLAAWMGETQLSHSNLTAARSFFDDADPEVVRLFVAPYFGESGDPSEPSPFMAFMLLYCGAEAFNHLMVGQPWTADLARIGTPRTLAEAAAGARET